jgi:hypothetical protein
MRRYYFFLTLIVLIVSMLACDLAATPEKVKPTAVSEAEATPVPAAPTPVLATSTPVPPMSTPITATVEAEALNVRTGPGVEYDRIGVVRKGDGLDVVARTPAGDWLKVIAPDGTEGWVAVAYITLNAAPDEIPEAAEIPPFPSPSAPTSSPTAAVPSETPISPPSTETGSVTGRILWSDEPFAGVVIKFCTDWSMIGGCKGTEYTAVSDKDGRYTIADLPPGSYRIATQIPGQENETGWMGMRAEVQSGEVAQVKDLYVVKYDLQLLSPHEEETVKTATPALTWAGYAHAAYYKVYLAPWGGGEAVIQFEKTAETTYTVASPLQAGKYNWSIHAYNARGTKLGESSGHFTVAKD